jgi:hypothetical protein
VGQRRHCGFERWSALAARWRWKSRSGHAGPASRYGKGALTRHYAEVAEVSYAREPDPVPGIDGNLILIGLILLTKFLQTQDRAANGSIIIWRNLYILRLATLSLYV